MKPLSVEDGTANVKQAGWNRQTAFVMGSLLGFMWCFWLVNSQTIGQAFFRGFGGMWAVLILALIDQFIEKKFGGNREH